MQIYQSRKLKNVLIDQGKIKEEWGTRDIPSLSSRKRSMFSCIVRWHPMIFWGIEEAGRSYFSHFPYLVIILFNMGLYRSAFFNLFFWKTIFVLFLFCVFNSISSLQTLRRCFYSSHVFCIFFFFFSHFTKNMLREGLWVIRFIRNSHKVKESKK